MSDKFRSTFPVAISFTAGELPSSSKMTSLGTQARQGLGLVEYALGDLWHQSGDLMLGSATGAPLMIPNLARALGASQNINPRIPYLANITHYTHRFSDEAGTYEARLPFPPAGSATYSWTGTTRQSSPETAKGDVNSSQEWWIDTDTGEIYAHDAFTSSDYLTYTPTVEGDLGNDARFNVIPDPDTETTYNFRGVKLEYKNGVNSDEGYYIYLPPRMPLDTRRVHHSPQNSVHSPSHSYNFQSTPSSATVRFWQSSSVAADTSSNAEHYRYVLPKLITDNWSQAATIPAGYMYLWDPYGDKTIIEGLVFAAENVAVPRKWVLVVTGTNLDTWLSSTQGAAQYPTASLQSSSHDPSYYPNNGLRLITVGVGLTEAFSALASQYLNHDHGSASSLVSRRVNHSLLGNLFDSTQTPQLEPSNWDNDDHSQYFHRYGANSIGGDYRDDYQNAILADMIISSTNSSSNYLNTSADSNRLYFGSSSGPNIGYTHPNYLRFNGTLAGAANEGFQFYSNGLTLVEDFNAGSNFIDIYSSSTVKLRSSSNDVEITAGDDVIITASDDITINANDNMTVRADGTLGLLSGAGGAVGEDISLYSSGDIICSTGGASNYNFIAGVKVRAGLGATIGGAPKFYFSDLAPTEGEFSFELSNLLSICDIRTVMGGTFAGASNRLQVPGGIIIRSTTIGTPNPLGGAFRDQGSMILLGQTTGGVDDAVIEPANSVVIENSPAGEVSFRKKSTPGWPSYGANRGENTALRCNRLYAGSYRDSTYEYSGTGTYAANDGWGRVRVYPISAPEWTVYEEEASWGSGADHDVDVTNVARSYNDPPTKMNLLIEQGAFQDLYAFHMIKIPFAHYLIQNVYIGARSTSYDLGTGDAFLGIGYMELDSLSWNDGTLTDEKDIVDELGTIPLSTTAQFGFLWTNDTTGGILEVENDRRDSNACLRAPFLRIRMEAKGDGTTSELEICSMFIEYRLQEW